MRAQRAATAALFLTLAGCSTRETGATSNKPTCAPEAGVEAAESLLWKRGTALTSDLGGALAFAPEDLCTELGTKSCLDAHRVALGSADTFNSGLAPGVARPLATSGIAVDRVVLSTCSKRVRLDAEGSPAVFKDIELSGDMPQDATSVADVAEQVGTLLYKRLLARDPKAEELSVLAELAVDGSGAPVSRADFVKLACFTVGTTTEFLLY